MVREAENNAAADKERRERIEQKNQADSLAYQAEKQINELGDKVPAAEKDKVQSMIKDLRDAINQENHDQIKTLTTDLQQALYSISSNLYQQGAAGPTEAPSGDGATGASSGSSDSDVIDAEFSETK